MYLIEMWVPGCVGFYQVPLRIHAAKDYLGHAMGKELRASLAVVDNGFAQAIMKKMD